MTPSTPQPPVATDGPGRAERRAAARKDARTLSRKRQQYHEELQTYVNRNIKGKATRKALVQHQMRQVSREAERGEVAPAAPVDLLDMGT